MTYRHASTSSNSSHGIMTPSGSSLNSRPSVLSETDHNDESSDPREQFHRERKKDKLEGKSHSFRKDKEVSFTVSSGDLYRVRG